MKHVVCLAALFLMPPVLCAVAAEPETQSGTISPYQTGYRDGPHAMGDSYDALTQKMRSSEEGTEDRGGTGAHFKLSHGNSQIDVKCSSGDTTEDCVNAAIILMDHIAMERREVQAKAAPQPAPPGTPPTPPAPQRQ